MLSRNLEFILNNAFRDAKARRHEFLTLEHLLLALTNDVSTRQLLESVGANIDEITNDLEKHIEENVPQLTEDHETQPTLVFQRVLQRAVFHVQSASRKEVTGADVLIAIFSERESQAVSVLKRQDVERNDIVNEIRSQGHADSSRKEPSDSPSSDNDPLSPNLRLDAVEEKLDLVLSEIRELSRQIREISDKLGPAP